jgi:hypothetical protein
MGAVMMSEKRNHSDYLQKAALYDMMGQFHKYSNPQLHMEYYLKHLKYMRKANSSLRYNTSTFQDIARIRFLHTSFDSPNIDVYVNSERVVRDLPFKQVSNGLNLKPGKYHIDIYPAGNMVHSVLNKKITIEAGKSYTLTTIDTVKKMRLLSFTNQPLVPLNEAKVRFIHLSPDMQAIDVAVKNRDVVFPNVTYKQATDYLGLTPMTVDLEVREAGSRNVILPMPKLQFNPNETYTIVFAGLTTANPNLQVIILRD